MTKQMDTASYIYDTMENYCLGGDSYVKERELYCLCTKKKKSLPQAMFQTDLNHLLNEQKICREDDDIYLTKNWKYEKEIARSLTELLKNNDMESGNYARMQSKTFYELCPEQQEAVQMIFRHRMSIVTGGAGTGKTTLIRALVEMEWASKHGFVLCAPTGKAARNLTSKVGVRARTLHSALNLKPDDDFLSPVVWQGVQTVIVDEASMLTLEMLAGILYNIPSGCRVVLLGDPQQLQAVGSGNILQDLLTLHVPHIHLQMNHRQEEDAWVLRNNVNNFKQMKQMNDFIFGESFQLQTGTEMDVWTLLVKEAVQAYQEGRNVQVITPFNEKSMFSVKVLNEAIKFLVNPDHEGKQFVRNGDQVFTDGDRVMITKNMRHGACCNGEIGTFRIICTGGMSKYCYIEICNGRKVDWIQNGEIVPLTLAYAITVHKSQGSEYDEVIMPMVNDFSGMLNRNLLYTAMSRAKKKMLFYGQKEAFECAVSKEPRCRKSKLIERIAHTLSAENEDERRRKLNGSIFH